MYIYIYIERENVISRALDFVGPHHMVSFPMMDVQDEWFLDRTKKTEKYFREHVRRDNRGKPLVKEFAEAGLVDPRDLIPAESDYQNYLQPNDIFQGFDDEGNTTSCILNFRS